MNVRSQTDDGPAYDDLEVSVFGPGRGESIAVHLGDGEWIVIDSCIDREHRRPAVLTYFERIGVNVSEQVIAVIATHWDSDHIRGLSEVLAACSNALFWCAAACDSAQFEALLDLTITDPLAVGLRFEELAAIKAGGGEKYDPRFALESTLILARDPRHELPYRAVYALSPSARTLGLAVEAVRETVKDGKQIASRVEVLSRNDVSVVIAVTAGEDGALLGADLERTLDSRRGWTPVVRRAQELGIAVSLVKIPHHGAEDAHDEQMWEQLLSARPAGALTPFARGATSLPLERDRQRIRTYTPHAFVTTDLFRGTPNAVDTLIAAAIPPSGSAVRLEGRVGWVRWRRSMADPSEQWRIELSGSAGRV